MEERAPAFRFVWASVLGIALLGFTYVLFDPDLGTATPLFQEFTCRGHLTVFAGDGYGEPRLRVPETGVMVKAFGDSNQTTVPAFFILYTREAGGAWQRHFDQESPTGQHIFYLEGVTATTEAYATAKDLSGAFCEGESDVIRAQASSVAAKP